MNTPNKEDKPVFIQYDNGSYKTRKSSMTKEEFFDDEMNSQRTERNLDKYCHYTGRGFKSYNELTLHDEKITENQYSLEDKKRPYDLSWCSEQYIGRNVLRLPDIKEMGDKAFFKQNIITDVYVGDKDDVKLGKAAFMSCERLRKVHLSDSIKELPESIFKDTKKLKEMNFPKSLEKIGDRALFGSTLTGDRYIPENVREIGKESFAECKYSGDFYFSENAKLERIGAGAFRNMEKLVGYSIHFNNFPDTVREIGEGAFAGTDIDYLSLTENVLKNIDIDKAFKDSVIPADLVKRAAKEIDEYKLKLLPGMVKGVRIYPDTWAGDVYSLDVRVCDFKRFKEAVMSIDGNSSKDEQEILRRVAERTQENKTFPYEYEEIAEKLNEYSVDDYKELIAKSKSLSDFSDRLESRLEIEALCKRNHINKEDLPQPDDTDYIDLVIPDGTKVIPEKAYMGMNIRSVKFPDSIEKVEYDAFTLCTNLTKIEMSNKTIENMNAYGSRLWYVFEGTGIKQDFTDRFERAERKRQSMLEITGELGDFTTIGDIASESEKEVKDIKYVHITKDAVDYSSILYELSEGYTKTPTNISDYKEHEYLTNLAAVRISGNEELNPFQLDKMIKRNIAVTIGDDNERYMQSNDNKLIIEKDSDTLVFANGKDIDIPDGIKTIGCYAFHGSEIESITIPDSVEYIDLFAFEDCKKLSEIDISEKLLASIDIHSVFAGTSLDMDKLYEIADNYREEHQQEFDDMENDATEDEDHDDL